MRAPSSITRKHSRHYAGTCHPNSKPPKSMNPYVIGGLSKTNDKASHVLVRQAARRLCRPHIPPPAMPHAEGRICQAGPASVARRRRPVRPRRLDVQTPVARVTRATGGRRRTASGRYSAVGGWLLSGCVGVCLHDFHLIRRGARLPCGRTLHFL
ncbi:hypothetical protein BDY17DRAFT_290728 [Neohortaea acidophila]|uniref:Uncharacterized protein n=1 Tax=Neohortaea acidophila TaxID=245834 RepID=A0A6A6Q0M1_9PEZI|nr:uncharacterized protein BDY17DRAFT_290728 [Neohortaea acidophila]KAF2486028.1 hypothetical protein BDY17DRAFT_290728 [Neohortaea acidophila]